MPKEPPSEASLLSNDDLARYWKVFRMDRSLESDAHLPIAESTKDLNDRVVGSAWLQGGVEGDPGSAKDTFVTEVVIAVTDEDAATQIVDELPNVVNPDPSCDTIELAPLAGVGDHAVGRLGPDCHVLIVQDGTNVVVFFGGKLSGDDDVFGELIRTAMNRARSPG